MSVRLRVGGVPEHFNLPWKQAIAERAFDDLDVAVEFEDYPGGTGAMTAALAAGDLDAALLLTEGAVADILNGADDEHAAPRQRVLGRQRDRRRVRHRG